MDRTHRTRILSMAVAAVAGLSLTAALPAQDQTDRKRQQQERQQQGQQQEQQQERMQDRAQQGGARMQEQLPPGIKWSEEPGDPADVRSVVDDVAGAAVIENGFNDVVERFVDQDRNRFGAWMGEGDNKAFTELNAAAKRFADAYQQKFGEKFDFDAETALAGLKVQEGEVEDPRLVAGHWPVPARGGMGGGMRGGQQGGDTGGEARLASGEQGQRTGGGQDDPQHRDQTNEDGNIEEGRQVAIATITRSSAGAAGGGAGGADRPGAGAGMGGSLRISLVNEFPGAWKIDVPNVRQPQQVYTDLTQCVDRLAQGAAQWPSDKAQVQQIVAFEVLGAIYGGGMGRAGQGGMGGGNQAGGARD